MVGVDEVGRGAWAGPLLVCAVRLNVPIDGLKDSKQLSSKKRAQLATIIKSQADVGYGWISANEIDDIGLSAALKLATTKALEEIDYLADEELVIDGNVNFVPDLKAKVLPRADSLIPAVSAASIVAKVARDEFMQTTIVKKYPVYGFEKHVGYGTKAHQLAIKAHGLCLEHRKSYNLKI